MSVGSEKRIIQTNFVEELMMIEIEFMEIKKNLKIQLLEVNWPGNSKSSGIAILLIITFFPILKTANPNSPKSKK